MLGSYPTRYVPTAKAVGGGFNRFAHCHRSRLGAWCSYVRMCKVDMVPEIRVPMTSGIACFVFACLFRVFVCLFFESVA